MSGLNLISAYSSDSEDDETNKDDNVKPDNTSNRLPLPETITKWEGVKHHEEIANAPSQHEGRIRSFKHERGNWATLVYLEYAPSQDMLAWMLSISRDIPVKCHLLLDAFHISVTRSLILKFHWIESFVREVKQLCKYTAQFRLELLNVREYCNEEKTRSFLGIECFESSGVLTEFVKSLDSLLAGYGLPPFYNDCSYHVSFLWCLGDETQCLSHIAPSLTCKLNKFLAVHAEDRYVYVNKIHLKVGNQLYMFQLKE